jgi:uroporphyrinogen III methyltransferase / synthase
MTLGGIRVLVTRPAEHASSTVRAVTRRGGEAILIPMISIDPPESWGPCDEAIGRLATYDAVIFTSASGARAFLGRLMATAGCDGWREDLPAFALGDATAAVLRRGGIRIVRVAAEAAGRTMAVEIVRTFPEGKRFLLPRGDQALEDLRELLTGEGKNVDAPVVYRTVPPPPAELRRVKDLLAGNGVDVLTFASPSAARYFALAVPSGQFQTLSPRPRIVVIGPTTAEAVRGLGYPVDAVSAAASAEGLATAIEQTVRAR